LERAENLSTKQLERKMKGKTPIKNAACVLMYFSQKEYEELGACPDKTNPRASGRPAFAGRSSRIRVPKPFQQFLAKFGILFHICSQANGERPLSDASRFRPQPRSGSRTQGLRPEEGRAWNGVCRASFIGARPPKFFPLRLAYNHLISHDSGKGNEILGRRGKPVGNIGKLD
jgi:hypothetical protein